VFAKEYLGKQAIKKSARQKTIVRVLLLKLNIKAMIATDINLSNKFCF